MFTPLGNNDFALASQAGPSVALSLSLTDSHNAGEGDQLRRLCSPSKFDKRGVSARATRYQSHRWHCTHLQSFAGLCVLQKKIQTFSQLFQSRNKVKNKSFGDAGSQTRQMHRQYGPPSCWTSWISRALVSRITARGPWLWS